MTPQELYHDVIETLEIKTLHPVHQAIMEECCENAISNPQNVIDKEILKYAVQVAFITANSALQETLKASLEAGNADQVTLNYRNRIFIIQRDSNLLKTLD